MSNYYVWGYKICHTATYRNEESEAAAPVLYQREDKLCEELDCIFHNARQSVQTDQYHNTV